MMNHGAFFRRFKSGMVFGPLLLSLATWGTLAHADEDLDINLNNNSDANRAANVLGQYVKAACEAGKIAEAKAVEELKSTVLPSTYTLDLHFEGVASEVARLPSANYEGAMSYILARYYAEPTCRYGIEALVKEMDHWVPIPRTRDLEQLYQEQAGKVALERGVQIYAVAVLLQMFAREPQGAVFSPKIVYKGPWNLMVSLWTAPGRIAAAFKSMAARLPQTDPEVIAAATGVTAARATTTAIEAAEQLPRAGRLSAWLKARGSSVGYGARVIGEGSKVLASETKEWLVARGTGFGRGIMKFVKSPIDSSRSVVNRENMAATARFLGNMGISTAIGYAAFGTSPSYGYAELERPKQNPSELLFRMQVLALLDLETEILGVRKGAQELKSSMGGRVLNGELAAVTQELDALILRQRTAQVRWNHFSEKESLFLHQLENWNVGVKDESDNAISAAQLAPVLNENTTSLEALGARVNYFAKEAGKLTPKKNRK